MERSQTISVGIVIERRKSSSPWLDHVWVPVGVVPGAPESEEWRLLESGPGFERYLAGALPLELHRTDTESYLANLAGTAAVYVVLRREDDPDAPHEVRPFLATVSAFEAEAYLISGGEEIVEPVPMSEEIAAWVQAFLDAHHVAEPFKKRQRSQHRGEEEKFAHRPRVGPQRRRLKPRGER